MSTKKKLLQAAAGVAGGAGLDVDEVFSTYLYDGTGSAQGISNGIALADGVGGGTSTQFDGSDDYFNRSSDLTGNADGKTFTFSAWIYPEIGNKKIYHIDSGGGGTRFQIAMDQSGSDHILRIIGCVAGSGTTALYAPNAGTLTLNAWNHILCSFDMANTSNRYVYINDVEQSVSYSDYVDTNLEFTMAQYLTIGGALYSGGPYSLFKGKIAHLFLDYTYRNLSTTSNRRLFIDADGGSTSPSTLSALNPIIYMPMTEDYSVGKNLGTGGDFTGNGSPTIVSGGSEYQSGVGEGGLVWTKSREATSGDSHYLFDTERGVSAALFTNLTNAESTASGEGVVAFNSDGFNVDGTSRSNISGIDYVSWTFRKAPKFFDVVTYTGDGSTSRAISHSLDSVPGMIVIKKTSSTGDWSTQHRSLSSWSHAMSLNSTNSAVDQGSTRYPSDPTSTSFYVGNSTVVNGSGQTYVAYLFAHNDGNGGFGPDGDQDIIKCGSYTGNGSSNGPEIDLGFEPQWIMIKDVTGNNWVIQDVMRGIVSGGNDPYLHPNSTSAETGNFDSIDVTATGFKIKNSTGMFNDNGDTHIYMAIRRGPLAEPESATDVFAIDTAGGGPPTFTSGFPVDLSIYKNSGSSGDWNLFDRLRGDSRELNTNAINAESSNAGTYYNQDLMTGIGTNTGTNTNAYQFMWKRAPSYFDVVAYTGTGSNRTVSHNLGVAPEMIWIKRRNSTSDWLVYHENVDSTAPEDYGLYLNDTLGKQTGSNFWNNTAPTASVFTVGTSAKCNNSSSTYIAYLFATLDGISKVGSYTGNGTNQNIDCGFSSGARFVLVKATNTTSNWQLAGDFENGIVAGSDSLLRLDLTNAVTNLDFIDPYSGGFNVTGAQINTSGTEYIFYAIA